jgi:predicted unusual protein kinase regulating ubiquinone biosynthesis (AarF/ABC1/UbiB family)
MQVRQHNRLATAGRAVRILVAAAPFVWAIARDLHTFVLFGPPRRLPEKVHRRRAARLTRAIARLGPTFIKLTQVVATRADLVPPVYLAALATLHDEVPPERRQAIAARLGEAYGRTPEEVFESFDWQPLAAASVAQVHRARYQGEEVIVKVLRPGIRRMVEQDLAILRRLFRLLDHVVWHPHLESLQTVVGEFSQTIFEEMDMEHEAENIARFQAIFAGRADVVIPEVVTSMTTAHVLVLHYCPGISITRIAELEAQGHDVHGLLAKVIKLYVEQVMVHGVFHADPHPGNILVDPAGRIVLLDFGLVVEIREELRRDIILVILAAIRQDFDTLVATYHRLGLIRDEANTALLQRAARRMYAVLNREDLSSKRVQDIANEILSSFYDFPFQIPSELVYFFKTAAVVEGLGTAWKPNYNAVRDMMPVIRGLLREFDLGVRRSVRETVKEEGEALLHLYRSTQRVLDRADRDELRVHIHPRSARAQEAILLAVVRRGIVALAALVWGGGAWLGYQLHSQRGLPVVSLVGSTVLFLWAMLRPLSRAPDWLGLGRLRR